MITRVDSEIMGTEEGSELLSTRSPRSSDYQVIRESSSNVSRDRRSWSRDQDVTSREGDLEEDGALSRQRRMEVNKTLPSCRRNPSTLNRNRKPLSEQIVELREAKKTLRKYRRKNWSCCYRLYHHAKTGLTASLESCWEGVVWNVRGCCRCCVCSCSIWGNPITEIKGYLGSHVSTYFKALVWLLKINLMCMLLGLILIVSPSVYLKTQGNDTTLYNKDSHCYETDIVKGDTTTSHNINLILQFFTGTGWMENTPLFIGWYPDGHLWVLNMAYIYTGVVLSYFLISLIIISNNVSRLFTKSAVETVEFRPYSDLVFQAWDYSITSHKLSHLKRVTIEKSLKEQLTRDDQLAKTRSVCEGMCVGGWRVVTNLLCFAAMGTFFYLIYGQIDPEADVSSLCKLQGVAATQSKVYQLWNTYSISIIMALGNTVYPLLFKFIGSIEFYKIDSTRVMITMLRSLVMKLATICTLLYLMYQEVKASAVKSVDEDVDPISTYTDFNCWENHLASKIYQLWIIHYIVFLAFTLFKKILSVIIRKSLGVNFDGFDITEEVLDLCYKQMIVWSLFPIAPLMTIVAVLETVIAFYIKKWVAMGFKPKTMVLTNRTVNVVNALFLLSLLSIFTFYGVMISNFSPSRHCTPFRGVQSYNDLFQDMTSSLGVVQDYVISTLRSITATVIIIVVFSVLLYYYKCAASSKDMKVKLLEERIRKELDDKKYLLEKITRMPRQFVAPNLRNSVSSSRL